MQKGMYQMVSTRRDLARLLLDWVRPLKPLYSPGCAMIHIGNTAAHYGEKSARMEGYTRVLWGLAPLFATENKDLSMAELAEVTEWTRICREGLIHGTDASHPEYWGEVYDYDQKMVEMAAIATALLLAPDKMWKPLSKEQKSMVREWLNGINQRKLHANNWRFFRILVNMFFTRQNLQPDKTLLEEDLQVIENCYAGGGWYFDGHAGQMDYYIPFAMHFYSLLYAHFMKEEDGERCRIFLERAGLFCREYFYWFAGDGSSVPFGRSLTYRFAHSAFFGAYGLAGEAVDYGLLKGMLLRNIRYWVKQPIFDLGGILTVGYTYPNLFMSERYNAPGSPYWSFKTFLVLAMPATHPFWQAEEKTLRYEKQKLLECPRMLLAHEGGHVQMYPVGHHSMEHGSCAAKYEKFVYSNHFGFSVPRGTTLESGAFDNTLAVSEAGENFYRMRSGVEHYEITEEYTKTVYMIGNKVQIESVIVPLGKWHVRIHQIHNRETIDVAEGGYAIPKERCHSIVSGEDSGKYREDMVHWEENGVFCKFPWGISGIADLKDETVENLQTVIRQPRLIQAFPNTNLLHNLTVIPTLCATLEPGEHVLVSCVYGDMEEMESPVDLPVMSEFQEEGKKFYKVEFDKKSICVQL